MFCVSAQSIPGGLINKGRLKVHIGNKLKWMDTCETSLNWGIRNYINHAQVRGIFKYYILDRVMSNQNGIFLPFGVK